MLKATQPRAGRKRSAMVPRRASPAAICASSVAALALPADRRTAAAVGRASSWAACVGWGVRDGVGGL